MSSPSSRALRARRLLWALPLGLVLTLAFGRLLLGSGMISRTLAEWVASALADRTRASVQVSGVSFDVWLAPCFEDFVLYRYHGPLQVKLSTPRACVQSWASAVGSAMHAVRIELEAPRIELVGNDVGRSTAARARTSSIAEVRVETKDVLREVIFGFDDLRIEWSGLPLPAGFGAGGIGPIDGQFILQKRGSLAAVVLDLEEPRSGTEVSGRLTPSNGAWELAAGIEGDVVSVFGELLDSPHLELRRLPTRGQLGARWEAEQDKLRIDVDLEQSDVDFRSSLVARSRLVGFSARERAVVELDLGRRSLEVKDAFVDLNGAPFDVDVGVRPEDEGYAANLSVRLRTVPYAELLSRLPSAEGQDLAERISEAVRFAAQLALQGRLDDPETWAPTLEYRFENLDLVSSGLQPFTGAFEYRPLESEGRAAEGFTTGPGTPGWVSYAELPYVLRRAIIVSEDATFPFHRGVEPEAIKSVLSERIEDPDEKTRGGSTISQQLVKNLFLSRNRTALRKGRELLITLLLESTLSKKEIFELYANLIEWGPGLYGIDAAARHYFGVPPQRLSPRQMAYLATIIPGPTLYHKHHARGRVPLAHRTKVDELLDRLHRLGQLEDEAWERAKVEMIRFAPEQPTLE